LLLHMSVLTVSSLLAFAAVSLASLVLFQCPRSTMAITTVYPSRPLLSSLLSDSYRALATPLCTAFPTPLALAPPFCLIRRRLLYARSAACGSSPSPPSLRLTDAPPYCHSFRETSCSLLNLVPAPPMLRYNDKPKWFRAVEYLEYSRSHVEHLR
jgi:hypothetical protein